MFIHRIKRNAYFLWFKSRKSANFIFCVNFFPSFLLPFFPSFIYLFIFNTAGFWLKTITFITLNKFLKNKQMSFQLFENLVPKHFILNLWQWLSSYFLNSHHGIKKKIINPEHVDDFFFFSYLIWVLSYCTDSWEISLKTKTFFF